MANRNADWSTSLDLACAWADGALAPVLHMHGNAVRCQVDAMLIDN